VFLFLGSLGLNLLSYQTSQRDMRSRQDGIIERTNPLQANRWGTATNRLNELAGLALLAGGVLLAVFVWRSV
jgi:hypothetical protein